jgi:very-short-patch-repair endonuclease
MQRDYMIQIVNIMGRLQFETISDFADPVLKINVEFPNVFWHNMGRYNDPLRDVRLEENGWKVINIKSKNPSLTNIEDSLKSV